MDYKIFDIISKLVDIYRRKNPILFSFNIACEFDSPIQDIIDKHGIVAFTTDHLVVEGSAIEPVTTFAANQFVAAYAKETACDFIFEVFD